MNSQTVARSAPSPPGSASRELARHPLRAERLGAGDAGGVEHERGAQARGELGDAPERVGVGERAFELGLDDRVELAWFVAAGVADGLLALGVGPAGAVGDQLAVVADEQPADDLPECAELGFGRLDQAGADVVSEPEVAAGRVGVAGPGLRAALLVLGGGVAELVVVEPGAGEVGLFAGGGRVGVVELLVDEVEHEGGVDDPDAGGEVLAAVVRRTRSGRCGRGRAPRR